MQAITKTDIKEVKKLFSGKVRDIYEFDEKHLLLVSTDRVSAFDHVFPNGIPGKGEILNKISNLWFKNIDFIGNHIVEDNFDNYPANLKPYEDQLRDRSVIVKKADKIEFECIARGYIIGSGWKDYQRTGNICGIPLPENLKLAQKLPESIFTPSTKAETGHDENISFELMNKDLGDDLSDKLKESTLKVYNHARDILEKAGIILADTKLEFGIFNEELILIDEVLTPDSSRFWDASLYKVGESPVSYDKQFIRDYIETTEWDKNSPAPVLPDEIISNTLNKYNEILTKIENAFK